MSRRLKRFVVVASILGALALYGFWFEPSSLRVVEHDVAGADGRAIFAQPLRIAVIGDLHAGAPYIDEAKIDRIVALTNAARPDLVLLAGDYVIQALSAANTCRSKRSPTNCAC